MPTPEIEEFAKLLVHQVRDSAIQSSDRRLHAQHCIAERWRNAGRDGDVEKIAAVLIPDIVDDVIFHLLRSVDQDALKISFTTPSGRTVDLAKDGLGELGGWYMGSNGWRAMFSHERFVDDFSDLK